MRKSYLSCIPQKIKYIVFLFIFTFSFNCIAQTSTSPTAPSGDMKLFFEDSSGNIWVGGSGGVLDGIYKLDQTLNKWLFYDKGDYLGGKDAKSIVDDN